MELTKNQIIILVLVGFALVLISSKEYFTYVSNSDQLQQDLYMTNKELEQTKNMLDNIDKLAQRNHEQHLNTINQLKAENEQIKQTLTQKEQEAQELKLQQAVVPVNQNQVQLQEPQMKPLLNVMAQSSIKRK